ncbi:unnamed protein product [Symbiodinium microadriaticum]|nr:unnamed protein product [Symbiodinium microadriaticum]
MIEENTEAPQEGTGQCNKSSKLRNMVDIGGDGKVNAADLVAWMLLIVFCGLFLASFRELLKHLYNRVLGENTENLIEYTSPLAQVMGTLVTVVYSFGFAFSSQQSCAAINRPGSGAEYRHLQKLSNFLDVNKDGRVGVMDWLCCVTGLIHIIILLVDVVLFAEGHVATADVVDLIASNTRVMILFMSSSFSAHQKAGKGKSGWRFLFDINHDGIFQLMDSLAMICTVLYFVAVTYSYNDLVFRPLGGSHVWPLISLTSQLNFILVTAFALVYLSKNTLSVTTERIMCFYALGYLVLLLRTVGEIYTLESEVTFRAISTLANGMVLGVTQLVIGSYMMMHTSLGKSM